MRDGERKKEKKTEKIKWKYKERENRNILKKSNKWTKKSNGRRQKERN